MQEILKNHLARYPLMQVQDLYKLLHQAAMGSEHAVVDETDAQKWLEGELATMGDGPDEPLLDPISLDGSIARLHLRPCQWAGVDPQAVLDAFLRTGREWHGSLERLQEYGRIAVLFAEQEPCPLSGREINSFFAEMEKEGFPARHHSPVFITNYHPAYRVASTEIWRQYESLHISPRPDHL